MGFQRAGEVRRAQEHELRKRRAADCSRRTGGCREEEDGGEYELLRQVDVCLAVLRQGGLEVDRR